MPACTCSIDLRVTRGGSELCPACLLRLALEPSLTAATDDDTTQILGPLGRGPHGSVFIGVRPDADPRVVSVKLLESVTNIQAFCERVRGLARVLDTLMHPAIPQLVEVGITAAGHPYVVVPFVAGVSLREFLHSHLADETGRLPIVRQLCSVVAALHERGVVHGSLKPNNVVVTQTEDGPWLFVLDTGIAEAIAFASGGATVTATRDEQDLRGMVAEILGKTVDAFGFESAAQLVARFDGPVSYSRVGTDQPGRH